jgi:putative endopeptidase
MFSSRFGSSSRHGLFLLAPLIAAGSIAALSASPPAVTERHGLDPADMDPTCKPCQDFYKFANGGWLKKNPVPPEYPAWGTFSELAERNREAMRKILERVSKEKAQDGSDEQKLGDFYASCMDEAAIEAQGSRPLAPELERIDKIQNLGDLRAEAARLQTRGVGVLFGFGSQQDRRNSSEVIAGASQGGIALPDRDYYTKTDAKSQEPHPPPHPPAPAPNVGPPRLPDAGAAG